MKQITKFKSLNLMGETPKQEGSRLLNQQIKAILQGKDSLVVREIKRGGLGYLTGTTKHQRRLRDKIRKGAGLS